MSSIQDILRKKAGNSVYNRGVEIFNNHAKNIKIVKWKEDYLSAEVKSSSEKSVIYLVDVTYQQEAISQFASTCDCLYDDFCKHEVAVLLLLNQKLKMDTLQKTDFIKPNTIKTYHASEVTIEMPSLYRFEILNLVDDKKRNEALNLSYSKSINITTTLTQEAMGEMLEKSQTIKIHIKKEGNLLKTSCNCQSNGRYKLCVHKAAMLINIAEKYGEQAFDFFKDWDKEKNELLKEYGFSLTTAWADKFQFNIKDKRLVLEVKKPQYQKINSEAFFKTFAPQENVRRFENTTASQTTEKKEQERKTIVYEIIDNKTENVMNNPTFMPMYANVSAKGIIKPLKSTRDSFLMNVNYLHLADDNDLEIVKKIPTFEKLNLNKQLAKRNINSNDYSLYVLEKDLLAADRAKVHSMLYSMYAKMFYMLRSKNVVMNLCKKQGLASVLLSVVVSQDNILPEFRFIEDKSQGLQMEASFVAGEQKILHQEILAFNYHLIATETAVFPIKDYKTYQAILFAKNYNQITIPSQNRDEFIQKMIIPLVKHFKVELPFDIKVRERIDIEIPEAKIYIEEEDEFLKLTPLFEYDDKQVSLMDTDDIIYEENGVLNKIKRNIDYETEMYQIVAKSHEKFIELDGSLFLESEDLLYNNWFLEAFENFKEYGFEILGHNKLKTFRYNINKPQVKMKVSSGIDWFDVDMQISFGTQNVNLKDVRKALLNKQHFVKLGDGSIGILPLEWLEKYSSILKLGDIDKKNIKLSKVHFGLLDNLEAEIDNAKVLKELEDKREKLLGFKKMKTVKLPQNIQAELRPYQEKGFQWLNFLDEFGWGGCLADDMGLGKTLQMLTFLKAQIDKYPEKTNLVVVPTSLIYNWVNEVKKFMPSIILFVHYGSNRKENIHEEFPKHQLIITTYGMITSDIEKLQTFDFHYVVLDEAHAIKNTSSQRYRAINLLKSYNRLSMTGTPVENNTGELYAQMNFLNRGILGSGEFFKDEFGLPIDRDGDKTKAQELKKIIYPFILRRTKEQVAKDLPEKTETVLYCEMQPKQRKVYEHFKNYYRNLILGQIESEGLEKSQMSILEGLLKLRQICDSPLLLNDKEVYDEESIKLETLMEHLLEVSDKHKVLVFSQFLGMLDLVKKRLNMHKIPYLYLDGQTKNRQDLVNDFQEDDHTRVFLMSLKAGGVGLNLTSAQYVFLIDPWWNPAVEKQAIDRTHRIGQTQNVFAYKLICKDTIEEKILLMQEKKKELADDIVSTDTNVMKKLNKADIIALFS